MLYMNYVILILIRQFDCLFFISNIFLHIFVWEVYMQRIYFEKWIDLNHELTELLSLSVDESINYKIESVGVRAIGSLIVKGEYNDGKKFHDDVDMDVLATFDKIVDQRDFNIKVEDFDYHIKDGNIQIKIEVGIHGVVDGEDRYVKDDSLFEKETVDEIEDLIRKEPMIDEQALENNKTVKELLEKENKVVETRPIEPINDYDTAKKDVVSKDVESKEKAVTEEIEEQLQEKVYPSKSRPIFKDSSDSIGTYYLYIVKENDNYEDVASRYEIDESIIRDYNQDKPLVAGNVLIIPYVCK